jgi:hypothetical protein
MKTMMGEILKNKLTGELYHVKKVKLEKVLLEAEDRSNKGWFGDDESLELFYEKVENRKG